MPSLADRPRTALPLVEPLLAFHAPSAGLFLPLFDEAPTTTLAGAVAVVRVEGGLAQRGDWWGDGYDAIEQRLRDALADPAITGVVLAINSPGGAAAGCFEAARRMREQVVASGKPCVTYADEMAASAGYALACVGDEIWLPPSGLVGSVGVISGMVSEVKLNEQRGYEVKILTTGDRKADGHPDVPITAEAQAALQRRVDHLGSLFFGWVAERRSTTADKIAALQADCFSGGDALRAGLADRVGALEQAVAAVASRSVPRAASSAASLPVRAASRSGALMDSTLLQRPLAAAAARPTQADITFAQDMIPHHEMALTMAKTLKRDGQDPALLAMADDILTSQGEQIKQLRAWLRDHDLEEKKSAHDGPMGSHGTTPCSSSPRSAAPAASRSGVPMDSNFLKRLGLAEGTPDEQAFAALTSRIDRLCQFTGKPTLDAAIGEAMAWKASHEQVAQLKADADAKARQDYLADCARKIDDKIKASHLYEFEREFATKLAAESADMFAAFMAARTQRLVPEAARPAAPPTKAESDAAARATSPGTVTTSFGVSDADLEAIEQRMNAQKGS